MTDEAGSRVIVKEVYAAGSYQVTSSDSIETQIVAGETADVDFTNDYNDKLIYSTGVVNHFEYDGTGWEWVQIVVGILPLTLANNLLRTEVFSMYSLLDMIYLIIITLILLVISRYQLKNYNE